MATASPSTPARVWDRKETDRNLRHPLSSLRGYIRFYVFLEGLAITLLFLGVWFWVGLGLDKGIHALFNFDWVKFLDGGAGVGGAFWFRAGLLGAILVAFLAVVIFTLIRRLFFEFSDGAVALALERRYPRLLGDRLITALELADPALAKKYGYSQAMVDQTIYSAGERVSQVSVWGVFNWGRLLRTWGGALLATLGIYALACIWFLGYSSASGYSVGQQVQDLHRNGWVWTQRNVLLRDRYYWPTRAYIEILRFQNDPAHPHKTVVAKNVARSDFKAKAFEWVIFAPDEEAGIRPLRYDDLKNWTENEEVLNIPLPSDWPHWTVDLDDLDPDIPMSLIPPHWDLKTTRFVQEELVGRPSVPEKNMEVLSMLGTSLGGAPSYAAFQQYWVDKKDRSEKFREQLEEKGVSEEVKELLDWRRWTVDKILFQQESLTNRLSSKVRNLQSTYKKLEKSIGWKQENLQQQKEDLQALLQDHLSQEKHVNEIQKAWRLLKEETTTENLQAVELLTNIPALNPLRPMLDDYRKMLLTLEEEKRTLNQINGDTQEALNQLKDLKPLDKLKEELERLAGSYRTNWHIRKLIVPRHVEAFYWGEKTEGGKKANLKDGKYSIGLDKLKESVKFRVWGEDYYTPTLEIELALPPMFTNLTFNELQPAYLFHCLDGSQVPLKGKKQRVREERSPPESDFDEINIPEGTEVEIVATSERTLKQGLYLDIPKKRKYPGSQLPIQPALRKSKTIMDVVQRFQSGLEESQDKDKKALVLATMIRPKFIGDSKKTFKISLGKITSPVEFEIVYVDKYNIEGRHRIAINVTREKAPWEISDIVKLSEVYSLKELGEDFRDIRTGKRFEFKTNKGEPLAGYLVTPIALVRFAGINKDDYGLTQMKWAYEVERLEFELEVNPNQKKSEEPEEVKVVDTGSLDQQRRLGLAVHSLQSLSPSLGHCPLSPGLSWSQSEYLMSYDLKRGSLWARLNYEPMAEFQEDLQAVYEEAVPSTPEGLEKIARFLKKPVSPKRQDDDQFKDATPFVLASNIFLDLARRANPESEVNRARLPLDHDISKEKGFDFREFLPQVQSGAKEAQLHYRVKIKVSAWDNDVDSGTHPSTAANESFSREYTFLVVSDAELTQVVLKKQELLRKKLEKIQGTLRDLLPVLEQAISTVKSPNADLENVDIRAEDIATKVEQEFRKTKDVFTSVDEMLQQMVTNRMEGNISERLENNVYRPMQFLLREKEGNRIAGEFGEAQASSLEFWNKVKTDWNFIQALQKGGGNPDDIQKILDANRFEYIIKARKVESDLNNLDAELQKLINAISGQLKEKEVIDLLVRAEKNERQIAQVLLALREEVKGGLLDFLLGDPHEEMKLLAASTVGQLANPLGQQGLVAGSVLYPGRTKD